MQNKISILGSTGSIGKTTLKIIDKNKKKLKPYLFSANKILHLFVIKLINIVLKFS